MNFLTASLVFLLSTAPVEEPAHEPAAKAEDAGHSVEQVKVLDPLPVQAPLAPNEQPHAEAKTEAHAEPVKAEPKAQSHGTEVDPNFVPPARTKKALCAELGRSQAELLAARKKVDADRAEVAAERAKLEGLKKEIADARAQLKTETAALEAALQKNANAPSQHADKLDAVAPVKPGAKAANDEAIAPLSKTIKAMKPTDAAAMVQRLRPSLAIDLLRKMKPNDSAKILAQLEPDLAAQLMSGMAARGP